MRAPAAIGMPSAIRPYRPPSAAIGMPSAIRASAAALGTPSGMPAHRPLSACPPLSALRAPPLSAHRRYPRPPPLSDPLALIRPRRNVAGPEGNRIPHSRECPETDRMRGFGMRGECKSSSLNFLGQNIWNSCLHQFSFQNRSLFNQSSRFHRNQSRGRSRTLASRSNLSVDTESQTSCSLPSTATIDLRIGMQNSEK
jgi:hypothetical protein